MNRGIGIRSYSPNPIRCPNSCIRNFILVIKSLVLFGLLVACVPTYSSVQGNTFALKSFGSFKCVKRRAIASPPTEAPPTRMGIKSKEGAKPTKPVLIQALCPDGQVPVATPAKPNVAKGNPLIGSVEGKVEEFFGAPKDQSDRIRKHLRKMEEVYNHGPGRSNKQIPISDPPGCNGNPYYGACFYYASASYPCNADGGGMTMTIERPEYDGSGGPGHTLDEIAVQGGTAGGDIVEIGWNVSTAQYPNANPHLFVFHWNNWSPTCYDACGWQQYSGTYFPGMDLGSLVDKEVYVGYVFYQGNWWAWFDNQWVGYFPGSEWDGKYTQSNIIQWYGEIATNNGIPPHTDMGNGLFPVNNDAARNSTLCDVSASDWICWYRDQQSWGATYKNYYDIDHTGFGQTRYGGPGELVKPSPPVLTVE